MRESIPITKTKKPDLPSTHHESSPLSRDARAQKELHHLLSDPANKFLSEIDAHRDFIDNADAQDALAYALQKIEARIERTFRYEHKRIISGVSVERVSYQGMRDSIETIMRGAREIGRGKDGFVVIDKNEIRNLPPEICYKFTLAEETQRDRNTIFEEMVIQDESYRIVEDLGGKIGVPVPFYAVEIRDRKVLAMEKLNAASIEDILRGKGAIPVWFDIDEFCAELTKAIDALHAAGIFHRDMHFGNVMISQSPERTEGEKMAYIIDFGLSIHAAEEMEPYKREIAGSVFTYIDDYVIVGQARDKLRNFIA